MTAGLSEGTVTHLYTYPIKGLSAQTLAHVAIEPGRGFPDDRRWALARAGGAYVPGVRTAIPKHEFHMLARDERLAGVRTRVREGHLLSVAVQHHTVLEADLDTGDGRMQAAEFFGRLLGMPPETTPVIAAEHDHRFTDVSVVSDAMMHAVSLINLNSVRELERRVGSPIDPLRFRANVYFDGLPAFSELELVGESVLIGGTTFRAVLNTKRCAATEVNPADARRDLPVPRLLMEHFGRSEIGVYVEARSAGILRPGDTIAYEAAAP